MAIDMTEDFEKERHREKTRLRESEIEIQRQKLEIERKYSALKRWTNPLAVVFVTASAIGFGHWSSDQNNKRMEKLESQKFQLSLILEATKADNLEHVARNLRFFSQSRISIR